MMLVSSSKAMTQVQNQPNIQSKLKLASDGESAGEIILNSQPAAATTTAGTASGRCRRCLWSHLSQLCQKYLGCFFCRPSGVQQALCVLLRLFKQAMGFAILRQEQASLKLFRRSQRDRPRCHCNFPANHTSKIFRSLQSNTVSTTKYQANKHVAMSTRIHAESENKSTQLISACRLSVSVSVCVCV